MNNRLLRSTLSRAFAMACILLLSGCLTSDKQPVGYDTENVVIPDEKDGVYEGEKGDVGLVKWDEDRALPSEDGEARFFPMGNTDYLMIFKNKGQVRFDYLEAKSDGGKLSFSMFKAKDGKAMEAAARRHGLKLKKETYSYALEGSVSVSKVAALFNDPQFRSGIEFVEPVTVTESPVCLFPDTPSDTQKSLNWSSASIGEVEHDARLCNTDAAYELANRFWNGKGTAKDPKRGLLWYQVAGELGNAQALAIAGDILFFGQEGIKKDVGKAAKLDQAASEKGVAGAQRNLGYMYTTGQGVTKDSAEAVKWFRKAAEQGDSAGQFNLGVMYEKGEGIEKNIDKALEWYRKAAAQGQEDAKKRVAQLTPDGGRRATPEFIASVSKLVDESINELGERKLRQEKGLEELVLRAIQTGAYQRDDSITVKVPEIAENGYVIPVEISAPRNFVKGEELFLVVNDSYVAATLTPLSSNARFFLRTRVKASYYPSARRYMPANIKAALLSPGKHLRVAEAQVKVTIPANIFKYDAYPIDEKMMKLRAKREADGLNVKMLLSAPQSPELYLEKVRIKVDDHDLLEMGLTIGISKKPYLGVRTDKQGDIVTVEALASNGKNIRFQQKAE